MPSLQVDATHYQDSYNNRERYYSYIEQILLVQGQKPSEVVEVGVGSGFVSRELSAAGITVRTIDLDPALRPDCLASVEQMPFGDDICDTVLCCQVLEHLPYEQVEGCLREIARITRRSAVISLPEASPSIRLEIARGYSPAREKRLHISSLLRPPLPHFFDGQHYWEIGKRGYPLSRIEKTMSAAGFKVSGSYRLHLNPYHHFFLLEK